MEKEPKEERVPMVMEASLLQRIEAYRFGKRIGSRSEAIRQLIKVGLEKEMPAPAGE
ncbi:hypothetical protein [Shinella zoogloeoides]|uniref:hypothetical protein n=1 Tax=Shinella zoogloeoides TaxID=352475 RepID=UPI00273E1F46|nr:hypothetical protein [Shinella zoogloeoides]WLR94218.1 hypothetical protein Q9316_08635 [Shinella zoogloeoides]